MSVLRTSVMALTLATIWQLVAGVANAQLGSDRINRPFNRPTVSPYLNLLRSRSGGNTVLNYYGMVRPQQQFYQQNQDFNRELNQLRSVQNSPLNSRQNNRNLRNYRMGITGHPAAFMSIGGAGGSGGAAGATGGAGSAGSFTGGNSYGGADSFGGGDLQFGNSSANRSYSGHSVNFGSGGTGVGG